MAGPCTIPSSCVPVLARKPGALGNSTLFKAWLLPAALERVRRKLAKAPGGDRQMVDVPSAVLSRRPRRRRAACAEALAAAASSWASIILNILPSPAPPLTITTPDALQLRYESRRPNCARYDRLRRAI